MKELRFRIRIITCFILLSLLTLGLYAAYSVKIYGTRWFSNGRNVRVIADKTEVTPGKIYDVHGNLLRYTNAEGERITTGNNLEQSALVHLLGDTQNQVSNGVEKFQARYLYGYDAGLGEMLYHVLRGKKRVGDDIVLTVDRHLNTFIAQQFEQNPALQGKNGAVVVMNYKTGEIKALLSVPFFSPNSMPDAHLLATRNPYFNRVTQSVLPPGSTFKVITMAAELAQNPNALYDYYNCEGGLTVGNQTIKDAGSATHNIIGLQRALEVSCNNIFANIALKLGNDKLKQQAENFGFNDNFLFGDIVVENSSFPKASNAFNLATSGIGQSRLLATPMHMCMVASAIANYGVMMEPMLLKLVKGERGTIRYKLTPTVYKTVLSKQVAQQLQDSMIGVVQRGTGKQASTNNMKIGGKTGSAESVLNGKPVTHAWFIGFNLSDKKPYALCVMVEAGGSGGRVAAPLAHKIFQYLYQHEE